MPPKKAAATIAKPAAKTAAAKSPKPAASSAKKPAADRPLSPASRAKLPSVAIVGAAPAAPPGVPVDMGASVATKTARAKVAIGKPVPKTGTGIGKYSSAHAAARAKRAAAPELMRGGRIRLRGLGHGIISMADDAVQLIQQTINRLLSDKVDKCVIIVSEAQRGIIAERDVLMAHRLSSGEELYSACDESPIYSLAEINGAVEQARNPKLARRNKKAKREREQAVAQAEHLKSVRSAAAAVSSGV